MANYVTNPTGATDTTGWTGGANRTISRVTSLPAPHPSGIETGFQVSASAPLSGTVNAAQTNVSAPSAGSYEHRWWVYVPSAWTGGTIDVNALNFTGSSGTPNANLNMNIRDAWQEVVVTGLVVASGDLTGSIQLRSRTTWNSGESFVFTGVYFGEPILTNRRIFPVLKVGTPYVTPLRIGKD